MFRYYKNLLFFVKNSFVHRGGGNDIDATVFEQPYPIIQETKESSDWKESTLFAGIQVSDSINFEEYTVYIKENSDNGFVDIKIDTGIFSKVIVEKIKKGQEQKVINEIMKIGINHFEGKKLVWNETKGKLEGTREDYESNKPLTIGDLGEQKAFFDSFLDDADLTLSELNSINYDKIEKILRQSFSANYQKDDAFINNRNDLIIAIDKVIGEYHKRLRQGDPNFKNHPRFDQFINYKENITNSLISDGKDFIDSVDKLSLPELLDTYKKAGIDDGKKYTLIQKIVDKHITGKGNSLAFGLDGEIIITTLNEKQQQVEAKDADSVNILNIVSQSDLKSDVLRNIISDSGLDISKDNPDYSTLVPKILDKYEIKDDSGGVFVFHDIFRRKDELKSLIGKKIDNADSKTQRDLQFVLDYIDNQKSYPKEFILKASEMSNLRKSGYDPTTVDGAARIEKAIKSGNAISTILNDIKSANGGLVGTAILIGTIIGLFIKGKWRTAALWSLGIQILGPAAEQLAHKWGLAEYILKDLNLQKTGESSGLVAGLENPFKSVDVTIKNIPKKYEEVYGDMYKKNTSGEADKMIFPQDYAQIFSFVVQKQDVRQMKLDDVKNKLANGDNPKDILGDANIPKKYIKGILQSKGKDKIIDDDDRNISDADMKLFLELLVSHAEPLDKTLGDAFVKGQETPTEYLDNKVYGVENTAISTEMDKISFNSPARTKLDEIVGRTKEVLSVDNAIATGTAIVGDNTKRKEQIQGIITELEKLKATDPSIEKSIDTIIGIYNIVLKSINLEDEIKEFETRAFKDGELLVGMSFIKDLGNTGIEFWSRAIGHFKLDPSFSVDKLNVINIGDIDALVNEGNTKLSSANEDQKKIINNIILKLREKKLAIMRAKDGLDPKFQKLQMSPDTQKALVELIEYNIKEYEEKIKSIHLEPKTIPESMQDYSNLFVKNAENYLYLKSIIDIDDSNFTNGTNQKTKQLKEEAKKKLIEYNNGSKGFDANLKAYIKNRNLEITTFSDGLQGTTLDDILKTQEQLQKIKEEFINDGKIVSVINNLGQKFGIKTIQTSGNTITDFEAYYKEILGLQLDLGSQNILNSISGLEDNLIKAKNKLLVTLDEKMISNFNQVDVYDLDAYGDACDLFIGDLGIYRQALTTFDTSTITEKEVYIKGRINEIENNYIMVLNSKVKVEDFSEVKTKWDKLKTKLNYEGKGFEKAYGVKIIESLEIPDFSDYKTNPESVPNFVINVKNYREKIKKFELSNKDLVNVKLGEIESKIKELELLFISELKPGDNEDIKNMDEQNVTNYFESNSRMSDSWRLLITKENLDFKSVDFDKNFKVKMEKLSDQLFMNNVSKITKEAAPQKVADELEKLIIKYQGDNGHMEEYFKSPKPTNMKELLERLEQAKKDANNFFNNNKGNKEAEIKVKDINDTINIIVDILKGNEVNVNLTKFLRYIRQGTELVTDYFSKP